MNTRLRAVLGGVILAAAAVVAGAWARAAVGDDLVINFDKEAVGKLPEGWTAAATHPGKGLATWEAAADAAAPSAPNVLRIAKIPEDQSEFNLCIHEKVSLKDVDLSVRMRANSGKEDQGGGLIWRVKDANNYYVCRFNPLEDNFRLYRVVDGKRRQLETAAYQGAGGGAPRWYTVRATMTGNKITCSIDGRELLKAEDDTFKEWGKIGLWTKADAASSFDDLTVKGGAGAGAPKAQGPVDGAEIERITGLKGSLNAEEQVFKVTQARTDVQVTVDGRGLEPFMGLTSWAAFARGVAAPCMVMGDLVLFQDEVNPVLSAALRGGLAVTALHNHFLFDEPKVYFMHIGGEGKAEDLARAVRGGLDAVQEVRRAQPRPEGGSMARDVPAANSIHAEAIETILGVKGQSKDGMFKAVIGRTVKMPCGCEVGKEMGVNTWAAFAGSDEKALVDGDFVTFEGELQGVLKALRAGGIGIVAVHSHMEGEPPRAVFLHYWGMGRAEDLARTVRAALDAQTAGAKAHGAAT